MRSRRTPGRWRTYTFLYLLLLLSLQSRAVLADEPKFPRLTGRVVDDAGILTDSTRAALTDMLAQHERETGNQVVVVTLKDLQGYTIEDFGYQLGRKWGIGQKGKNNGVLLIVAPNEHRVRIEVGYGLEGTLTDAIGRTIIDNYILPSFKRGDYNAGVLAGTTSMLRVLGGSSPKLGGPAKSFGEGRFPPVSNEANPPSDLELAATLLLLAFPFIVFLAIFSQSRQWGGSSGPYGWSSGGSSGGGGGFSGGGGSFGGGGASGGW
jgi:uncharacterized protein